MLSLHSQVFRTQNSCAFKVFQSCWNLLLVKWFHFRNIIQGLYQLYSNVRCFGFALESLRLCHYLRVRHDVCLWTCSVYESWLVFLSNQVSLTLLCFIFLSFKPPSLLPIRVLVLPFHSSTPSSLISILFAFQSHFPPEYNFYLFPWLCIHR